VPEWIVRIRCVAIRQVFVAVRDHDLFNLGEGWRSPLVHAQTSPLHSRGFLHRAACLLRDARQIVGTGRLEMLLRNGEVMEATDGRRTQPIGIRAPRLRELRAFRVRGFAGARRFEKRGAKRTGGQRLIELRLRGPARQQDTIWLQTIVRLIGSDLSIKSLIVLTASRGFERAPAAERHHRCGSV